MIKELNERSRHIFRSLVEAYLADGSPVGSKTISAHLPMSLSPASIRNVMKELETLGLIYSPHTSAGRIPTHAGLRMFVDAMLEVGNLTEQERRQIETSVAGSAARLEDILSDATTRLSGLSRCAGLVLSPKKEAPLKHVEFVQTGPEQALVILVSEDGNVENRIIGLPQGMTPAAITQATNYLNARVLGRTLAEARTDILDELEARKAELDELTSKVVEAGLATWGGKAAEGGSALIVRGRSNLLEEVQGAEDLERIRVLFDDLERKQDLVQLLELSQQADGVRIFIGAENKLFSLSGSSVIIAPYMNAREQVVGAIGVIGPTRLNYARIIPMVDYTAKVIGQLLR